jgi:O-antigen ligase
MSSSVATRPRAVAPVSGGVVAALAVAGAVVAGGLLAARPALGAAILGAACYLPLVMSSVAIGIAVWIPVLFVKTIPQLAATYMLLLMCAAWAGSLVARPATIQQLLPAQRFLVGALGLLLAWLSLSVIWADDPGLAWMDLRAWFFAAAVLIVVATTITSPGRLRLILLAFAFGAVLSVVIGWLGGGPHVVAASIDPAATVPKRFGGAEGNPNYLAMQLVPAIVLAAALVADRGRAIVRWGLAACVAVLTVGLASTQSRGGLLAAAVVALAAIVVYGRRWSQALLVALALAVTVAGAWLALSPQAPRRVFRFDDGGAGRSTLWRVAWRVAKAEPVQGVGLNNFRAVAPGYVRQPGSLRDVEKITDRPHVVHNTYLQLLAETGVVGLGLFLAVVIACLAAAWRAATAFDRLGEGHLALLSRAVLLACVGGLAAQMFASAGSELRLWLLLALGPALWTIAKRPLTSTRP